MPDEPRALVFLAGSADVAAEPDDRPPDAILRGWVGLVASERGLRYLGLPAPTYEAALRRIHREYPNAALAPDDAALLVIAEQVRAYLTGNLRVFSVDLDLRGHMPFELAVWAAAARIPYGETRTYGWIAAQVGGGPGAAQAVGAALGDNPVPLIIPCHRVLGFDGSLHGFAGGLEMKARLLDLERGQGALTIDTGN
jgi:methylated-DNA-[protein]-cysteine S-methyltransferase